MNKKTNFIVCNNKKQKFDVMDNANLPCAPVIKWAGGKTQLLNELKSRCPKEFKTYYEPFFGSGALFFSSGFKEAVVNDTNFQLYTLYENIKNKPEQLICEIDLLVDQFNKSNNKKLFYYNKRNEYNNLINSPEIRASALFVFINKTCFNGLYRTNSEGKYNVPFGQKKHLNSLSKGILEVSKSLQRVKLMNIDFNEVVENAGKDDFVYFDPPYYNTFTSYQANGFGLDDQIRLARLFKELSDRGVYCMLSNSNEDVIKELYQDFNIEVVHVKRNINRKGDARKGEEVIIRNYE